MWMGKKVSESVEQVDSGQMGVVTVGGERPAVFTHGELRQLPVAFPKGVWWRPDSEDNVLVVDGVVAGCLDSCPRTLEPGEIYISGKNSSILLNASGDIRLYGTVYVNNQKLG